MYEARNFYANNIAMTRDVANRFPFGEAETYRGQCAMLAKQLKASGVKLWRIRSATVSHPPPEGLKHFVNRAICQGHDALLINRTVKKSVVGGTPLGSLFRFFRDIVKSPARIWRRRQQAGLGPVGMVSAFALSTVLPA